MESAISKVVHFLVTTGRDDVCTESDNREELGHVTLKISSSLGYYRLYDIFYMQRIPVQQERSARLK